MGESITAKESDIKDLFIESDTEENGPKLSSNIDNIEDERSKKHAENKSYYKPNKLENDLIQEDELSLRLLLNNEKPSPSSSDSSHESSLISSGHSTILSGSLSSTSFSSSSRSSNSNSTFSDDDTNDFSLC